MATQILVIFLIRSSEPFWKGRPHRILVATSLGALALAHALALTPLGRPLGFVPLAPSILLAMAVLVVGYLAAAEVAQTHRHGASPRRHFGVHRNGTIRQLVRLPCTSDGPMRARARRKRSGQEVRHEAGCRFSFPCVSDCDRVRASGRREDYPNKPIHVLTTSSAGGISDIFMRVLGEELHKSLGQPIIIENRPGGAGNIARAPATRPRPTATRSASSMPIR